MLTFKSVKFVGLALLVAGLALFASAVFAQDTAVSEASCVAPQDWGAYVVQPNDTLTSIARVYSSSVEELTAINCIAEPSMIRVGASIIVPPAPADYDHLVRRCRIAGLTTERCRALAFGNDNNIAERCRLAGLTPERCRELVNGDDDNHIAERCRLAGLTPERCRALIQDAADRDPITPIGPVEVDVVVRGVEAAPVETVEPTADTSSGGSRPTRGG